MLEGFLWTINYMITLVFIRTYGVNRENKGGINFRWIKQQVKGHRGIKSHGIFGEKLCIFLLCAQNRAFLPFFYCCLN